MTLSQHISQKLSSLGLGTSVQGDDIIVKRAEHDLIIRLDDEWKEGYAQYAKAKSLNFDPNTLQLQHNRNVEFLLNELSGNMLYSVDQYRLTDDSGNSVTISFSSQIYALAHFDSTSYEEYFNQRIKKRLLETRLKFIRVNRIFYTPITAAYTHKGRRIPANLVDIARKNIESSLFKLAVEHNDCYSVWEPAKTSARIAKPVQREETLNIPKAVYDDSVVRYYKIAKSSPFPSQSFLAYYHVLEYYFSRVSELLLHDRLSVMLNMTNFKANKDSLNKLISAVRGQDARSDETEMLRNVIDRFVDEGELIDFVTSYEHSCGEKVYSKKRMIFGEQIVISPIKDHAISNSAKALKHIRNAIVHSSDKYKREDCHIPLSESEIIIEEFIPLLRFFAEKVIFGTAV